MRKSLQRSIPFPAPAAAPRASRNRAVTHDTRNAEARALILADPEAYGGEGSLPVIWARATASAPEGQRKD